MLAVTKAVDSALKKSCDAWHLRLDKLSFERSVDASAKTATLKAVQACYKERSIGHLAHVCSSRLRLLDGLRHQHGARFAIVSLFAESRLLLHLGRASVLENVGLYADRTTGLPLIPGTAFKGIVSTWACWEANQKSDGSFAEGAAFLQQRKRFPGDLARRIFGDDSKEGSEHAGDVVFVGGYPASPPNLGLDIVNPHYEPNGRDKTNLSPNAFLCVEPGTLWHFAFYVRPGAPDAVKVLQTTADWLTQALTQLGIGAKTSAGYGRFRQPNEADRAAQKKREEETSAAQTTAVEQAKVAAEKARQQAAAQAAMNSDYPNDATFKNRVLDVLNPSQLQCLEHEVALLQKPENEPRREQLKKLLAAKEYRDIRKRLREKDWFPKEWLPS
jgi:CRISPR-associated protein Cmr6